MRTTLPHRPRLRTALALALIASAAPAAEAQSPPPVRWSGSIEVKLDLDASGYSRHETQTWTLTGEAPKTSGAIALHPAKWHYTGGGSKTASFQDPVQGPTQRRYDWSVDVTRDVQLAIFIRDSDKKLTIHQWTAPVSVANAITAAQSATIGGAIPTPTTNFTATADQWNFGWLEAEPAATDVSGSNSVSVGQLPVPMRLDGSSLPLAACTWDLTRGPAAGPQALAPRVSALPFNAVPQNGTQPLPAISQLSPATVGQANGNYSVAITGDSTHFVQGTSAADFGGGIAVTSLTVNSPTSATAHIQVTSSTALGARTVAVTTATEVARKVDGFSVVQGTVVGPPPPGGPAPTSGYYRIILNGLRVNHQTFHDFFNPNGNGDEVYFAANVATCTINSQAVQGPAPIGSGWAAVDTGAPLPPEDQPTLNVVGTSVVKTAVHGIASGPVTGSSFGGASSPVSGHIHAGSATAEGGLTNGDVFPSDPGRTTADPVPYSFPFLVWQGQLTDNVDAILIYPTLWKWIGDATIYDAWAKFTYHIDRTQRVLSEHTLLIDLDVLQALRSHVVSGDLSPFNGVSCDDLFYDTLDPATYLGAWVAHCDHSIGIGTETRDVTPTTDPNDSGDWTYHRSGTVEDVAPPADVVAGDAHAWDAAFIPIAIVVTRQGIEDALASRRVYDPALPPGIIPIHFVDQGSSGNYDLFLRVERAPTVAATASPNVSTTQPSAPHLAPANRDTVAQPTGAALKPRVDPTIQLSPTSGARGAQNLIVTITRPTPYFSPPVNVPDFGPGIISIGAEFVTQYAIRAHINIDPSAPLGAHTVTLTRFGGMDTFPGVFTVTAAHALPGSTAARLRGTTALVASPALVSVSPNSAAQGNAGGSIVLEVVFTGQMTHFAQGVTMVDLGPGISNASNLPPTVVSPTEARAFIAVSQDAPLGPHTVTVTTGNEVVRLTNGFTVTP